MSETQLTESHDLVVVGGGIAGSALAAVLARRGFDVLVLERQEIFEDRVRGEWLAPWGVAVADGLGLSDTLLDPATRANVLTRNFSYDENLAADEAEAAALDVSALVPGVAGAVTLGHPEACEALARAALASGATMQRGVTDVVMTPGAQPAVAYTKRERRHRVTARLVVGADGRNSAVRRQLGLALHGDEAKTMGAGVLVEGLDDWPLDTMAFGTAARVHYYVFPQTDGKTRLYLQYPLEDHGRFSGPHRVEELLAAFVLPCIPQPERFLGLRPVRLCASYPFNDTWTKTPLAPGSVLVGDAGGYNDPIIGQGLALSLQDVATLSELLASNRDWSPAALEPYAEERRARMSRARASALLYSALFAEFGPEAAARRAEALPKALADEYLAMPILAPWVGYHAYPGEAFTGETRRRILVG